MERIKNLSFNQKRDLLLCNTDKICDVYSLTPSFEKILSCKGDDCKYTNSVKMYNQANIFLLCGQNNIGDNMINLWDISEQKKYREMNFDKEILNSELVINESSVMMIILSNDMVTIFNHKWEMLYNKETCKNPLGLLKINDGHKESERLVIATLGNKIGSLIIWLPEEEKETLIQAFDSEISSIGLSRDGSTIGVSSDVGTVIKVYNVNKNELLFELRRGTTSTTIYDIAFNYDSKILACCSGNGTAHIFELCNDVYNKNTRSMLYTISGILPSYFSSQWSFKKFDLETKSKIKCGFDGENKLHICSYDGIYYRIYGNGKEYDKMDKYSIKKI